jgi:hypothetical protein
MRLRPGLVGSGWREWILQKGSKAFFSGRFAVEDGSLHKGGWTWSSKWMGRDGKGTLIDLVPVVMI